MITFDLECSNKHRFEGTFKDYDSFSEQLERGLVRCPLCNSSEVKRLFTGCSIQPRARDDSRNEAVRLFEAFRIVEKYVKENFKYVKDFPEKARAIHYGIEEERNIYGEASREEIAELREEGINVLPLPDIEKLEQ